MGWSSPLQPNPVGSEYILMERVRGRQLSGVWNVMSEAQRFGLVKSMVEIERKLMSAQFRCHGSLYYKDTYPHGKELTEKFVFGPTTERTFWEDQKRGLGIDRGPCMFI
jgi:hypothetical protein